MKINYNKIITKSSKKFKKVEPKLLNVNLWKLWVWMKNLRHGKSNIKDEKGFIKENCQSRKKKIDWT